MTLTQLVTPGVGGRLDVMNHAINMVNQNIGVLQHNLTRLFNIVGTLEQKINNLSQNGTVQLIKGSLNNAQRDELEVCTSTLTAELDLVQQLTEVRYLNTYIGYFKSLADVTVWMRANIPSDAPKFEHFIDFDILLAGICQIGVSSEEVRNKGVNAKRVKLSGKQYVVVMLFQRTHPED